MDVALPCPRSRQSLAAAEQTWVGSSRAWAPGGVVRDLRPNFVLRTREHRVAGLPTDARTVLRASIAVEGLVLMLVIIIVVLVATVVL